MISYDFHVAAMPAPLLISNTLTCAKLVESQKGGIFNWNILHGRSRRIVDFISFMMRLLRKPIACRSICPKRKRTGGGSIRNTAA